MLNLFCCSGSWLRTSEISASHEEGVEATCDWRKHRLIGGQAWSESLWVATWVTMNWMVIIGELWTVFHISLFLTTHYRFQIIFLYRCIYPESRFYPMILWLSQNSGMPSSKRLTVAGHWELPTILMAWLPCVNRESMHPCKHPLKGVMWRKPREQSHFFRPCR